MFSPNFETRVYEFYVENEENEKIMLGNYERME
jgi:hypothetical protein